MSDESPRSFTSIFRLAFSYQDIDSDSEDIINVEGRFFPLIPEDEGLGSFDIISEAKTEEEEDSTNPVREPTTPRIIPVMSSTSGTTSTATPGGSVTINGRRIEVGRTAQPVISGSTPLFKKENRAAFPEDKRNDQFDKARRARTTKFDSVPLTLSEEDKLDDTYNIGIHISQLRNHFVKFHMDDIYTIVTPVPVDLFAVPPQLDTSKLQTTYFDLFE
jgi:hypothetical protein